MKTIQIDEKWFNSLCQRYDYEYRQIMTFGDGAEAIADLSETVLHELITVIENKLKKAGATC